MNKRLYFWALSLIFIFITAPLVAADYGPWGVDLDGMDTSLRPGDDFFRYVNGKWAQNTQIPPDKSSYGAFMILRDLSEKRVREIIENWAGRENLQFGSDEAKVASIYRTFLNEACIEELNAEPIKPYLGSIYSVQSHEDMAVIMAHSLYGFGSSFFKPHVGQDGKNPTQYVLYLSQSGLGLPDRDYYLRENFKEHKERYEKYVGDMLRLIGWAEPEENARHVVALETQIAEAHWSRAESRNRDRTYNPTTINELKQIASGFPWEKFFHSAGLSQVERIIMRQNTALVKLAAIYSETPISILQAWAVFHVVNDTASLLSSPFVQAHWEFNSHFLDGDQEQRARWKRAVESAESLMGEAIGRTYVEQYFPPDSKAKMESLVHDLLRALETRIKNLHWMSPETKANALLKLAMFGVKIGYPSKWIDYSMLDIKEGDLVGNVARGSKFEWDREIEHLGKEVDKEEWSMTPQTVNAYYSQSLNEIVFPAAILQPPFFNPNADSAVNYGGIGGVIGHEITHGFDDQGRKADGSGMLRDWWTAEDALKFEEQAARLGAQYEAVNFPDLPGLHINPRLTMGENIGDLGGIILGLDAYRLSLNGATQEIFDGFSGDQRVFLGWAQVWRTLTRTEARQQRLVSDPHSPGEVRAYAPLRNVDAWYEAFDVREGDAHFINPEDRVRIW